MHCFFLKQHDIHDAHCWPFLSKQGTLCQAIRNWGHSSKISAENLDTMTKAEDFDHQILTQTLCNWRAWVTSVNSLFFFTGLKSQHSGWRRDMNLTWRISPSVSSPCPSPGGAQRRSTLITWRMSHGCSSPSMQTITWSVLAGLLLAAGCLTLKSCSHVSKCKHFLCRGWWALMRYWH